jgi:hypothetical protein
MLAFAITCDAPTEIALSVTDNVAGSAPNDVLQTSVNDVVFGMGLSNGQQIGGYTMAMKNLSADTNSASGLVKLAGGWVKGTRVRTIPSVLLSWATGVADEPAWIESLTGELEITPSIRPKDKLNVSDKIDIKGSATLSLHYL